MPTIVRQATIADRDAIAEFIKIAYGSRSRFIVPDRWDWQYRDHPLIDQSQQNLNIWIAIKDDKVVGQICGWPVDLKVKDVTHRALWGCDLMVLPVCRGEGIAGRLARGLIDHCGLFIGIMQTPVARHIYEKMGCVDLEPVPVHGRLCRFDRGFVHEVVSRRLATRPRLQKLAAIAGRYLLLDWFVALAGNVALRLRDLFQRRAKPRDRTEVREVDCFGEDIDRLWNATKDQFEVIGHRDRQFANWRFTANKQINYRKYIAVRDGETTGYLVLRHPHAVEMGWGFIVDLYAARDDRETLEALISKAIDFFGRQVSAIKCVATPREYREALEAFGFRAMTRHCPNLVCTSPELKATLEGVTDRWFITQADQDLDQIVPA